MGERGGVRTYHSKYTVLDKATGKRRLVTSKGWAWRFSHHGRRYNGGGGMKQGVAQAAGERRMAEVKAGQTEDPARLTFDALAPILFGEYALQGRAAEARGRSAWRRLSVAFGGWRVVDITRTALIEYLFKRRKVGGADGSIRLELAHLRRAMHLAIEQGRLRSCPRFPMSALPYRPRQSFFRPDELELLVAALRPVEQAIVTVAHETGWRLASEILTREWRHVDFGPETWRCEKCDLPRNGDACACEQPRPGWLVLEAGEAKTREPRVFPMTARLRATLARQREATAAMEQALGKIIPWVFPAQKGGPYEHHRFRDAWREACARAGLVGKRPHDLRRTAAMRWESQGLARSVSMALGGWKTAQIFNNYAQVDARALRQALGLMADSTAGPRRVVPFPAQAKGSGS